MSSDLLDYSVMAAAIASSSDGYPRKSVVLEIFTWPNVNKTLKIQLGLFKYYSEIVFVFLWASINYHTWHYEFNQFIIIKHL